MVSKEREQKRNSFLRIVSGKMETEVTICICELETKYDRKKLRNLRKVD